MGAPESQGSSQLPHPDCTGCRPLSGHLLYGTASAGLCDGGLLGAKKACCLAGGSKVLSFGGDNAALSREFSVLGKPQPPFPYVSSETIRL